MLRPSDELLAPDERLELYEEWLGRHEADALHEQLLNEVQWAQGAIELFGKRVPEPRLTAWYGDPEAVYTYSGRRNDPLSWLPELATLRARLEAAIGTPFNSVLLNLYRDGRDSMGLHSDDERELGSEPTIASLSLGATRRFRLQHRSQRGSRIELSLTHGSLLLMGGALQQRWRHGLAKQPAITEPRINLTYRSIHHRSVT